MAPVSLARLLTGLSMVLFASGASSATAEAVEPHTVLTIHWGREDFPGTSVVDAAIRGALQKPGSSPVRYFSEYLETEEFPSEAATLAFRDYIRRKYVGLVAALSQVLQGGVYMTRGIQPPAHETYDSADQR